MLLRTVFVCASLIASIGFSDVEPADEILEVVQEEQLDAPLELLPDSETFTVTLFCDSQGLRVRESHTWVLAERRVNGQVVESYPIDWRPASPKAFKLFGSNATTSPAFRYHQAANHNALQTMDNMVTDNKRVTVQQVPLTQNGFEILKARSLQLTEGAQNGSMLYHGARRLRHPNSPDCSAGTVDVIPGQHVTLGPVWGWRRTERVGNYYESVGIVPPGGMQQSAPVVISNPRGRFFGRNR